MWIYMFAENICHDYCLKLKIEIPVSKHGTYPPFQPANLHMASQAIRIQVKYQTRAKGVVCSGQVDPVGLNCYPSFYTGNDVEGF
jgi:hypothetical protein